MTEKKPLLGFIGQGFIGKNYSDDFEQRGYTVIRYSLEEPYQANKEHIRECDIVFIAVPAPTVPTGKKRGDGHPEVHFDGSTIREVIGLAREGAIVVIKSTIEPGTTELLQAHYADKLILHSPEFLLETTAAQDAKHPERNIIGIPKDTKEYREAAERVIALLPKAPYTLICDARTAELIKYANNAFLFIKIVFANIFYELAKENGIDWEVLREAIGSDPRIGPSHLDLHLKDDPPGVMRRRGAGRSCFIKDFAELSELYAKTFPEDKHAIMVLRGFEYKNSELLRAADRYINLLEGVYGPDTGKK